LRLLAQFIFLTLFFRSGFIFLLLSRFEPSLHLVIVQFVLRLHFSLILSVVYIDIRITACLVLELTRDFFSFETEPLIFLKFFEEHFVHLVLDIWVFVLSLVQAVPFLLNFECYSEISFVWNLSTKEGSFVFLRIKIEPLRVFFFFVFVDGLRPLTFCESLVLATTSVVLLRSGRTLVLSPCEGALKRLVTLNLRFL
jgi:hypothetical protein